VNPTGLDCVFRSLARLYGPIRFKPGGNLLDILIQTILSQNTSDQNSWRAFRSLKKQYPRWTLVVAARPAAIALAIRSGGLSNIKAPRIREALGLIQKQEGRFSLDRIKTLSNEDALNYLTSFRGVGIKTAACVLLFGLGRPVMPVDTHVHRVTRRLGWVGPNIPAEQAGAVLEKMIAPRRILALHLYLVRHGRKICRAPRPLCRECPLPAYCRFFKNTYGRTRPH
jgi:endonuclease III